MSEANQIHNPTCDNCGEEIKGGQYVECELCGAKICTNCEHDECYETNVRSEGQPF